MDVDKEKPLPPKKWGQIELRYTPDAGVLYIAWKSERQATGINAFLDKWAEYRGYKRWSFIDLPVWWSYERTVGALSSMSGEVFNAH